MNPVYVGVDLDKEEVTIIARYPELVCNAYTLVGEHSGACDGTIYIGDDGTFNGRRALAIALAETEENPIGLGWTFKPRYSAAWVS